MWTWRRRPSSRGKRTAGFQADASRACSRNTRSGKGVVFSECAFLDSSFCRAKFNDCEFRKCRFRDTNLSSVELVGCRFVDCTFAELRIGGTELDGEPVRGLLLRGGLADRCGDAGHRLRRGLLDRVDIADGLLMDMTFRGFAMNQVTLSEVMAPQNRFEGVSMTKVWVMAKGPAASVFEDVRSRYLRVPWLRSVRSVDLHQGAVHYDGLHQRGFLGQRVRGRMSVRPLRLQRCDVLQCRNGRDSLHRVLDDGKQVV